MVHLEQRAVKPDKSGLGSGVAFDSASEAVGGALDLAKDNHWQEKAEIKSGNVYLLRKSTDEPVAPGEKVILRWRTPEEFKHKQFVYARNPRAQVENKVSSTP